MVFPHIWRPNRFKAIFSYMVCLIWTGNPQIAVNQKQRENVTCRWRTLDSLQALESQVAHNLKPIQKKAASWSPLTLAAYARRRKLRPFPGPGANVAETGNCDTGDL